MKTRSIISAFLTLIAVGCAKEQPVDNGNLSASGRTIVVNMPEITKTALGDETQTGVKVVWSAGDQIAVIEGKGTEAQKHSVYTLVGEGGTTSGTFEYVEGDALAETITDIVFPASAVANNLAVPTSQTYVEGSFDADAMVMSWTRTSEDEVITLSHEAAALMFTVTGTAEQTIGHIEVVNADNTYTLKCEEPVALSAAGKVFYVAVPGNSTNSDYEVNFYSAQGTPMVKNFTKVLGAGTIGRLPSLAYTPFHNLKWGDIYGGGLVFEMKGKTVKILSLDEGAALKWATSETAVVRLDDQDMYTGAEKVASFKALSNLSDFPAAAWCLAKEEGWYLPAIKELQAVKANLKTTNEANQVAINATIAEYNGTPMSFSGKYYWTCEEFSANTSNTAGNFARCYSFKAGGEKTKKTQTTNRLVRAVKTVTLAGGETPDAKPENVVIRPALKDIYEGGLVFEVGGDYVKIVSLDEAKVAWSVSGAADVLVTNTNPADGTDKDKLFRALSNLSDYPAAAWCIAKGEGWYLPSREELKSLRSSLGINSDKEVAKAEGTEQQNAINSIITQNGGASFKFGEYHWTSDEKTAGKAVYSRPCDNDGTNGTKTSARYVRAVKKITFEN